jgi:cell division protein FtsB
MQYTLKDLWDKLVNALPKPLRNFFVVSGVIFVLWMIFLDVDRLPIQFKKMWQNRELKNEVKYYQEKIEKGNQELKGLKTDKEKQERFAREKYYMHRDSEDVFVIERKEKE